MERTVGAMVGNDVRERPGRVNRAAGPARAALT